MTVYLLYCTCMHVYSMCSVYMQYIYACLCVYESYILLLSAIDFIDFSYYIVNVLHISLVVAMSQCNHHHLYGSRYIIHVYFIYSTDLIFVMLPTAIGRLQASLDLILLENAGM